MACAIPVAVCHGQRFILHYLSASKQTRLLSSTVGGHAQTTVQPACLLGAAIAFSLEGQRCSICCNEEYVAQYKQLHTEHGDSGGTEQKQYIPAGIKMLLLNFS